MNDFTFRQDERGHVAGAFGTYVHLPSDNPAVESVLAPAEAFTQRARTLSAELKPEALPGHLRTAATPLLSASRLAIGVATREARATAEADARSLTLPPSVSTAAFAEIRSTFGRMGEGERMARITRASLTELGAVLDPAAGNVVGLSEQGLDMARDRFRLLAHIEVSGLNGAFPSRPSLDGAVLAIGSDAGMALEAGKAAIKDHAARLKAVEASERTMRGLVGYIAAALSLTPSAALDAVLAA